MRSVKSRSFPLDVHLMIDAPSNIEEFRKAGADWLTVMLKRKRRFAAYFK